MRENEVEEYWCRVDGYTNSEQKGLGVYFMGQRYKVKHRKVKKELNEVIRYF